jgi:hypothetical protein
METNAADNHDEPVMSVTDSAMATSRTASLARGIGRIVFLLLLVATGFFALMMLAEVLFTCPRDGWARCVLRDLPRAMPYGLAPLALVLIAKLAVRALSHAVATRKEHAPSKPTEPNP